MTDTSPCRNCFVCDLNTFQTDKFRLPAAPTRFRISEGKVAISFGEPVPSTASWKWIIWDLRSKVAHEFHVDPREDLILHPDEDLVTVLPDRQGVDGSDNAHDILLATTYTLKGEPLFKRRFKIPVPMVGKLLAHRTVRHNAEICATAPQDVLDFVSSFFFANANAILVQSGFEAQIVFITHNLVTGTTSFTNVNWMDLVYKWSDGSSSLTEHLTPHPQHNIYRLELRWRVDDHLEPNFNVPVYHILQGLGSLNTELTDIERVLKSDFNDHRKRGSRPGHRELGDESFFVIAEMNQVEVYCFEKDKVLAGDVPEYRKERERRAQERAMSRRQTASTAIGALH